MKKRILALLLTVLMVTALLPFGATAAGEKLIAVTFDDGPSQYTAQLLDGLAARGAKATFFMLGEMAQSRQGIVKRAWEEGHQICSHSYNHPNLNTLSSDQVRSQFSRTDGILDGALGFDARFMIRPPYGNYTQNILNIGGVPFFYWSVDTEDWKSRNADSVYNMFLKYARDGSIVLLHDIYPTSVSGALRAIDTLKSQGYEFVTVAELFYRRGVTLNNAQIYYSCAPGANGTASALSTPKIQQSADPNGGLSVTIQGDSRGTVYYTTNGAVPNPANSKKYTGPFTVNSSCTVKAVTVVDWNSVRSGLGTAKVDYIPAAAPVIAIEQDTMTMTSATSGAQIRYTTDGSAPNQSSTLYNGPVTVSKGTTVRAFAAAPGYNASAVTMLTYTANGNLMKDVRVTDWHYSYLDRAVSMGVLKGTEVNVMSPNQPLTRAMLVTMLHRLAQPEGQSEAAAFSDIKTTQYYYEPVCWAAQQGIVVGYPDGTFQPNKSITRQELSVMIARYLRSAGYALAGDDSALDAFKDKAQIQSWAKDDLSAMAALGVIRGYENGTIGPQKGATRAEAVTMLLRAADLPAPVEPEPDVAVSEALQAVLDAALGCQSDDDSASVYAAAATLLNFVRTDAAQAEDLADQIQVYRAALSEEALHDFETNMDAVLTLAQQIAKGDVTAEETDAQLADANVTLAPVDPQTFPHEALAAFAQMLNRNTY